MSPLRRRLSGLHSDHKRIALGAMRVAFFLLLGKAAGALKEMAVAYRYGVSDAVDAYQFTMVMAHWLPMTIVGAMSVVLIPVLTRTRKQSRHRQRRFLGELHGWALGVGAIIAVGIYVAWPWVIDSLGRGLNLAAQRMSAELALAFAPAALFTLLTGLHAARLRAREKHINTLLDSVPAIAILICVMLAGAISPDNIAPLLWGTLVGYAIQAAWLWWLAARADGIWGSPRLSLRAEQWPDLVKAAGVMLVGQIAMSFVGPIDQYTAAQLDGNANSTLGYAARLLSLVLGLGAASVGRAALPVLADVQSQGDAHRARSMALKWSAVMLGAGVAATALGWLLAPWGVSLIFERGAFSASDTAAVTQVLRWGLLQLPFYFGVLILVQLLASQNRYRIMAAIAVINFGVKAILNPILAPIMGTAGIMLATSVMYAMSYICYVFVALRPVPSSPSQA